MMQKVLTKHWLTIHVGLVVFCSWLTLFRPQVSGSVPLLWLSLLAIEAALLLPSVRRGETLASARMRVLRAVVVDPFFYVGLAVVLFITVQWLNSGCKLVYLADADVWQFTPPAMSWAPFSVEPAASLANISIYAAIVVVCLCLRHAVSQTGKRLLLQAAVVVSGVFAIVAVVRFNKGVELFVDCAYGHEGCSLGPFFGFWMIMGMGVFAEALARKQRGIEMLFVLGVVSNLVAMLLFSKALPLALYVIVSLLLFIYWLSYLNRFVPKHVQLKLFFVSLAVIISVTLAVIYVFPENPVLSKMKGVFPVDQFWHAIAQTREVRTSAALRIWQDHPWEGVGADGFRHFVGSYIGDQDWRFIKMDPSSVYNDCMQFLCEYGLLGFGLMLAVVISLLVPICYRMRLAWRSGGHDELGERMFLLRISPLVLTGVVATGVCFLESWYESPLHSQSMLISWVIVLSMVPAFLPTSARAATQTR